MFHDRNFVLPILKTFHCSAIQHGCHITSSLQSEVEFVSTQMTLVHILHKSFCWQATVLIKEHA
jgi:hypothetical protein